MIRFGILFVALFAVGSCSTDFPVEVTVEERASDIEKTVAKIGVEGMMCEIACGGKIRKELSELNGVASASVDFADGQSTNYALVEYNPAIISEKALVETINRISDGKLYSVTDVHITRYLPTGNPIHASGEDGVNMQMPTFVVPGIADMVWNLIGGFRR